MSNELEHRGYKGSVEYNSEDRILFGKVLFIDSLLMYHGATVDEIEAAFRETVDSYLQHCEATGKQPNKPYSGSFNVRVGAERHRAAAQLAYRKGCSLNEVVCQALDGCLANEAPETAEDPCADAPHASTPAEYRPLRREVA